MNIDSDVELKFLANEPVDLGGVYFHVPTLREIIRVGEKEYNRLMSTLLIGKDMIQGLADSEGYDELTNFDIAYVNCHHDIEFWKDMKSAINIFFKEDVEMSPVESAEELGFFFYFGDIEDNRRIDKDNFDYIQSLVMVANNVKMEKDEDYNPVDERARALIESIKKTKAEVASKKEQITNLSSKISGMAWKFAGINIFNIFDLTFYQFLDGLLRLDQVDNYQFTISGMYAGTVDGKKVKMDSLHWTKKL